MAYQHSPTRLVRISTADPRFLLFLTAARVLQANLISLLSTTITQTRSFLNLTTHSTASTLTLHRRHLRLLSHINLANYPQDKCLSLRILYLHDMQCHPMPPDRTTQERLLVWRNLTMLPELDTKLQWIGILRAGATRTLSVE
jgi:hypothetical protein